MQKTHNQSNQLESDPSRGTNESIMAEHVTKEVKNQILSEVILSWY